MSGLERRIGVFDATMINVGVMVGSGVFLIAGDVARAIPHAGLDLACWVVAALFSLAGALTIAELGAAMPRAGGLYVYLREAFGPLAGFLYGWALLVVIQTAAIAAIAVALATYAAPLLGLGAGGVRALAIAVIAALTALNMIGVREGVLAQNASTVAKVALMLGLAALALGHPGAAAPVDRGAWTPSIGAIGAAMIGPLFAFDGWITSSYVAGELRDPGRTIPRAAILSIAIVTGLYLALNGAYLHVLGVEGVAASELPAADTARGMLGPIGATVAACLVALTTIGSLNGCVLGGARVTYALADAGLFWRAAAKVHPRTRTPVIALAVQGVVSIGFVLSGSFDELLTSCLFASWLFYAMGGIAVIVLRWRRPDLARPYRVWGYPFTSIAFVIFAGMLLLATVAAEPRASAIGAALLATGIPAYALFRRAAAQRA